MADLKKIFDALAGVDGGAALAAALEAELKEIRGEAANHRVKLQEVEKTAKAQAEQELLAEIGVKDKDALAGVKSALEAMQQRGLKPDEVAQQIAALTKQVKQLTQQSEEDKRATQAERDKRINAMRSAKTVEALTAAKAIKPAELAKILAGSVQVKEDDTLVFLDGDKELPLTEGIANYLKANPEFVANTAAGGSGGGGSGPSGGEKDPEKMTMAEYMEWRKNGGGK